MAFVRNVSTSAHLGISQHGLQPDYEKAVLEHKSYISLLEKFLQKEKIYVLEQSEKCPDCCFVEDVIVSISDIIVVNNVGADARKGEKEAFMEFFKKNDIGKKIIEMKEENGTLDGGDVLYIKETGDLFIGHTERTCEKGIQFYQSIFKDLNVIKIRVTDGLHLKSFITQFGTIDSSKVSHLIISGCKQGKNIFEQIQKAKTRGKYVAHYTKEERAANCLILRSKDNFVLVKKENLDLEDEELYQEAIKSFEGKGELVSIKFNELYKLDGCLTCCSVLIDF